MSRLCSYLRLFSNLTFGSQASKRWARYHFTSALAKRWGLNLYHLDNTYHQDPFFINILDGFPGKGGYTPKRYNLFYLAKGIAHLDGDTVECGVASGITSYLISRATYRDNRHHHAFDSFEGLPEPINEDAAPNNTIQLQKGEYAVDIEDVQNNLKELANIHLYQGWIPERFREVSGYKFILVHVDVDFYQPTLDALLFFYERIVPGGIIVCDDYGFIGTPGAKKAMDDFFSDKPEPIVRLDSGQAIILKV